MSGELYVAGKVMDIRVNQGGSKLSHCSKSGELAESHGKVPSEQDSEIRLDKCHTLSCAQGMAIKIEVHCGK